MAKCRQCGRDAGFMMSLCEVCIQQSETQLRQQRQQESERAKIETEVLPPGSIEAVLTNRYREAYIVARAIISIGGVIKGISWILAAVIMIGTLASQSSGGILLIGGILSAVFVGISLYLLGILVQAQGQIFQATLDTAVNTSPFLTNNHKAYVMSLPVPEDKTPVSA